MLRYELMDHEANTSLLSFVDIPTAATFIRGYLSRQPYGAINRLMLVDRGAPGEPLTYPLEGAPLLAMAFGLEAEE